MQIFSPRNEQVCDMSSWNKQIFCRADVTKLHNRHDGCDWMMCLTTSLLFCCPREKKFPRVPVCVVLAIDIWMISKIGLVFTNYSDFTLFFCKCLRPVVKKYNLFLVCLVDWYCKLDSVDYLFVVDIMGLFSTALT